MIRTILPLMAVLGMAACAGGDPIARGAGGACALIPLAQMPLKTRANQLLVEARINDQPVTLLVDTGAERTLLTEAAVDHLRLPRDPHHATRTFGIGSPSAAWDARLPNGIVLGPTRFPVDSVTVGHFGINQAAGGSADGLLGADILLAFDVDIDAPAHRITFYRARRECPDAKPPWNEPYTEIPGVSTRRDRMVVPFKLDGVDGTAVLDTGAQASSISRTMAARVGLAESAMAGDRTVMAHGASPDQVAVRIHRFNTLQVGSAVIHDPAMPVVPTVGGMGDGLVGADFLRDRRVWLSFSAQRLFVTPLETGPWIAVTQTPDGARPAN
jgi:predicted aspartyl protease